MLFNWFNHLGVQKKMIISNLLIIIVPFVVLITSLAMVWGVIRYTNPVAHRQWMMLAPSTIQSQVFQLGLEQINKELSKKSTSISDILDSSAVLEAQGLNIVILKDNQLAYSTSGLDVDGLLKNFDTTMDASGSVQFTYVNSYGT